jgi:TRAP-type C4-dicarboxylate transport system permease small subunit
MPILVFFAVAFAYGRGAMVRIELLTRRVSASVRKVFNYFAQIVSAIGTLCLLVANVMQVQRVYDMKSISAGSWHYPLWPAYVILVVGLTLMFICMCMDISKVKTEESSLLAKPAEEETAV